MNLFHYLFYQQGLIDQIDLFYLDNDVDGDERLKTQVRAFDEFMDDLPEHIVFVAREVTLYYKIGEQYVKGRFDALFYDTIKKKWIVVDWKTSGTVDTKPTVWTTKLLGPARVFDALNWNTYTMQVYFYKTALIESGYLPQGTTFDAVEMLAAETGCPLTQKQNKQLRRDDPEENACGIDSGIGNGWFIVVHSA